MKNIDENSTVQIDVKQIEGSAVHCNLYTPEGVAKIVMDKVDYDYLVKKGFFIRDGKERDSANILNTTDTYAKLIK